MPKFFVTLSYDVRFTKKIFVEADDEDDAIDLVEEEYDLDPDELDEWDRHDCTRNASEVEEADA